MSLSDPDNPYARPNAWTVPRPQPTRAEPEPEPVRVEPPVRRNSIYSGSAIPLGPPPQAAAPTPVAAPEPRPHPEIAPVGEPPPPLRTTTFVAPPLKPRRSLRRHVPLIGSLATAAAGFALMAFVLSRPAPELPTPPVHRPTHIAASQANAAERPQLRGALQRLGLTRRAPARAASTAPSEIQPVSTAPMAAPVAAATPIVKPAAPRFTPPPTPDPDAPIATRPPYS